MDFSKTAIFSDLDGTLFTDDKTISEGNISAINRYIDEGGTFAISTGRIPSNLRGMINGLPINGVSIVSNGSGLYDISKAKYLWKKQLDQDIIRLYMGYVMDGFSNAGIIIYAGNSAVFVTPKESADPFFVETHMPCFFQKLEDIDGFWLKALIDDTHKNLEKIQQIANIVSKRFYDGKPIADLVFSNPNYLEILPHGANKGTALNSARKLSQYAGKTIFAIGDYYNDIELIEAANVACAPANALYEVKERANIITNDNNHDALADLIQFIEKF